MKENRLNFFVVFMVFNLNKNLRNQNVYYICINYVIRFHFANKDKSKNEEFFLYLVLFLNLLLLIVKFCT